MYFVVSKDEKKHIIDSYEGGESANSIAKRFGVGQPTIAKRLRRWGVKVRRHHPKKPKPKKPTYMERLEKRFWAKVDKRGPDDCWPWTGAQQPRGYGSILVRDKSEGAHRVSFELNVGPIGEGQIVAHLCDNPNCVNPRHLLTATHKFNSHDSNVKGRYGWTASWKKDLE